MRSAGKAGEPQEARAKARWWTELERDWSLTRLAGYEVEDKVTFREPES